MAKPTEATFEEAIEYLELSEDGSIEWRIANLLRGHATKVVEMDRRNSEALTTLRMNAEKREKELQLALTNTRALYQHASDENIRLKADIVSLKRQLGTYTAASGDTTARSENLAALERIFADREKDAAWQSAPEEKKKQFADEVLAVAQRINALNGKKPGVFDQNTLRTLSAAAPPPNLPPSSFNQY